LSWRKCLHESIFKKNITEILENVKRFLSKPAVAVLLHKALQTSLKRLRFCDAARIANGVQGGALPHRLRNCIARAGIGKSQLAREMSAALFDFVIQC
jgi:hypothetical protein